MSDESISLLYWGPECGENRARLEKAVNFGIEAMLRRGIIPELRVRLRDEGEEPFVSATANDNKSAADLLAEADALAKAKGWQVFWADTPMPPF